MLTPGRYPATRSSARMTAPSAALRWTCRSGVWSVVVSDMVAVRRLVRGGEDLLLGLGEDLLLLLEAQCGVVVGAEVGVDDPLVAHHAVRRAFGDDPALGHHDHPVGDV